MLLSWLLDRVLSDAAGVCYGYWAGVDAAAMVTGPGIE